MSDEIIYRLYVPIGTATIHIDDGSAIIGEPRDDGYFVHYERGGASNVQTFEEKILHAADRRAHKYPTAACAWFPKNLLKDVGSVEYDQFLRIWKIASIDDLASLTEWAPGDHVIGRSEKLITDATSRMLNRFTPLQRMMVLNDIKSGANANEAIIAMARSAPPEN